MKKLYKTASVYTSYYSFYAFDGDKRDIKNVDKIINYFSMKNGFHCTQIKTTVTLCQLMDKKAFQKFHYARKNEESELALYKRSIKRMNDTTIVREEFKPMAYIQFDDYVVRNYIKKQIRIMRSKA